MADELKKTIDNSGVINLVKEIKAQADKEYLSQNDVTVAKTTDIKITGITVNGETVSPVDKVVGLTIPTDTEISKKISDAIGGIKEFNIEVVTVLPTENIKSNTIYLVPSTNPGEKNIYDEYIYLNVDGENKWELIGSKNIDLTGYLTAEQVEATYVKKVTGKDLSTNDFDNNAKTKLEGIEEGAQKNTVTSVAGKTGAVIIAKSDIEGLEDDLNNKLSKSDVLTAAEIQTAVAKGWAGTTE